VASLYPNLKLIASTLRSCAAPPTRLGAIALYKDKIVHVPQTDIEIMTGGRRRQLCIGLIYGLLADKGIDWAVRCGVAHGALAMTTPGDTSMATLPEVNASSRRIGAHCALERQAAHRPRWSSAYRLIEIKMPETTQDTLSARPDSVLRARILTRTQSCGRHDRRRDGGRSHHDRAGRNRLIKHSRRTLARFAAGLGTVTTADQSATIDAGAEFV